MAFEGISTAIVTPILENGQVDYTGLKKLIRYQLDKKIHNLVVLGGTGEYLALSDQERKKVIDISVKEVNNKVPVIVGILAPGIEDTIDIAKYAKGAGADAIMPITPYYVAPTQERLIHYFEKLDLEANIPIILYNIPSKTNVNLEPKTVDILIERIPNIKGIKECALNFGQMIELIELVGNRISVLAGDEFYAVTAFLYGAKGAIVASGNIVPDRWVEIWNQSINGDFYAAKDTFLEQSRLYRSIFMETNPGPLKYAMRMLNIPGGFVKDPLGEATADTRRTIDGVLKELKYIY